MTNQLGHFIRDGGETVPKLEKHLITQICVCHSFEFI